MSRTSPGSGEQETRLYSPALSGQSRVSGPGSRRSSGRTSSGAGWRRAPVARRSAAPSSLRLPLLRSLWMSITPQGWIPHPRRWAAPQWIAPVLSIGLAPIACTGAERSPSLVPDEVACPTCTIEVRAIVRIGDLEGPGQLERSPASIAVDSLGRYIVIAGELPQVFDRNGAYQRTIGRRGAGPGELSATLRVISIPGDSLLVLDREHNRGSVFGPEGFNRGIQFPGYIGSATVIRWPDSVLVVGVPPGHPSNAPPLYMTSLSGPTVEVGKAATTFGGLDAAVNDWILLAAHDEPPWFVLLRPYRILELNGALVPVRYLERRPEWWTENRDFPIGIPHREPPHPIVRAASIDDDGLVWVYVLVASESWRDAWSEVPIGAMEISSRLVRYDELFDTLVEVIDPENGRVIARHLLPDRVVAALPDGRAVSFAEDLEGAPRIQILDVSLVRPERE